MSMKQFAKRLAISVLGGILIQFLIILLDVILGCHWFAFILLLPGWAFGCAGRDSEHGVSAAVKCWLIMLSVNCLIYGPIIYAAKWWRPFRRREPLSILSE